MLFAPDLIFGSVARHVPRTLLSEPSVRRLHAFIARLPAAFTWGGLELRLQGDGDRVDFGACATSWEGCRPALAAALEGDRARDELPVGSLRPFLERWSRSEGLTAEMPYVWLEYDDPVHPADAERDPVLFFSVDPQIHQAGPRTPIALAHLLAIARSGLTLALGVLPDALWENYERCTRLFPDDGRVMSAASLQARGLRQLRMDASVPHPAIVPWLDAIGWPGDRRALAHLLELLGPGWNRNNVELDLCEEGAPVGPALGLLYHPTATRWRKESWLPLFNRLVELGLCDRDCGRAAVEWVGAETVDLPGAPWHVHIYRELGLKLETRPGGELRAKAYLYYSPRYALF